MDIQEFARKSTKPCTDKTKKRNEMAYPLGWRYEKAIRWPTPPRGFKGNTMAKPRPEWMKGSGD